MGARRSTSLSIRRVAVAEVAALPAVVALLVVAVPEPARLPVVVVVALEPAQLLVAAVAVLERAQLPVEAVEVLEQALPRAHAVSLQLLSRQFRLRHAEPQEPRVVEAAPQALQVAAVALQALRVAEAVRAVPVGVVVPAEAQLPVAAVALRSRAGRSSVSCWRPASVRIPSLISVAPTVRVAASAICSSAVERHH
jgi:hypothetical protein